MFPFFKIRNNSIVNLFCMVLVIAFAGCVSKTKDETKTSGAHPRDLALQYLSQNQLDEAQAAFQQAIKLNPHDTSSYIGLTRLYMLQKNYDAAEKLDKEALKFTPDNLDLKLLLAKIYGFKNEKEKAAEILKEIVTKDPKNAMAFYMLAELDSGSSDLASRKNYLLQVQNLLPANIIPRIPLTEIFAKEGKIDSSLFYLQSVKKIAPAFSQAAQGAYEKAVALLHANQAEQATAYLEQFHELMRISPEYGSGLEEIEIPKMIAGYFDFDTNVKVSAFDSTGGASQNENTSFKAPLSFKLISGIPGSEIKNSSNAQNNILAVADYDPQANMYIYSSYVANGATTSTPFLSVNQSGTFKECGVTGGIEHKGI